MNEERKREGGLAVFIVAGCFVVALVVFTAVVVGTYLEYRVARLHLEAQRAIAQKAAAAKAAQDAAKFIGPKDEAMRYRLRTLLVLLAILPPLLWIGWTKYEAWRAEREQLERIRAAFIEAIKQSTAPTSAAPTTSFIPANKPKLPPSVKPSRPRS